MHANWLARLRAKSANSALGQQISEQTSLEACVFKLFLAFLREHRDHCARYASAQRWLRSSRLCPDSKHFSRGQRRPPWTFQNLSLIHISEPHETPEHLVCRL